MTLPLSRNNRRYGYIEDTIDHRDFGIMSSPVTPQHLKPIVNQEIFCGPVLDQENEGSCTAHFGAGQLAFLMRKYEDKAVDFSPAYIYWLSLQMDAWMAKNELNRWPTNAELLAFAQTNIVGDDGSMGRTVCRVLNQFGACLIGSEAYVAGEFATPPTAGDLNEGMTYRSGAYHRLGTVFDMKTCLMSGYAFGIGFNVYESFENIGSNGLWNPKPDEAVLGGHEVLVIGYDDSMNTGSFKVRNSWGSSWGASGNFWLKYSDAANPAILMDAWLSHLGKAW